MSAVEGEGAAILAVASAPKVRRRRLRSILLALMAQYTIVSMIVGLSVAGILRYVVTPQIVDSASEGTEDLRKNFRIKVK